MFVHIGNLSIQIILTFDFQFFAGLANCSDVLPIYIGDDRTDEDAFKVLQDKGDGYGILVSAVPKETCACYSLRDPSEVL